MAWAPNYGEREVLKTYVSQGAADVEDTEDNTWLDMASAAASRAIDRACNDPNRSGPRRQFGLLAAAEARYYTPYWSEAIRRWCVEIDDLMITAGVTVVLDDDGDDLHDVAVTDYLLRPRDAASRNLPYTQLVFPRSGAVVPSLYSDSVKITARWGWSPTWPDTISQAWLIQASRFFTRRLAPFGVRGSAADDTEENLEFAVDPDVQFMLGEYKREVETL